MGAKLSPHAKAMFTSLGTKKNPKGGGRPRRVFECKECRGKVESIAAANSHAASHKAPGAREEPSATVSAPEASAAALPMGEGTWEAEGTPGLPSDPGFVAGADAPVQGGGVPAPPVEAIEGLLEMVDARLAAAGATPPNAAARKWLAECAQPVVAKYMGNMEMTPELVLLGAAVAVYGPCALELWAKKVEREEAEARAAALPRRALEDGSSVAAEPARPIVMEEEGFDKGSLMARLGGV